MAEKPKQSQKEEEGPAEANAVKPFSSYLTDVLNKLECLSLKGLSSLV